MRFPLSLTTALTGYLLKKKLAGQQRFPLVLMLEPLHACNLSCAGCGRIREYADSLHARMSVEECLASVEECGAPVVSICGGEPLIYPEIERLVARNPRPGQAHLSLHQRPEPGEAAAGPASATAGCSSTSTSTAWRPRTTAWCERGGTFAAAVAGIQAAKAAGLHRLHQHDLLQAHRRARDRRALRLLDRVGRGRLHDRAGLRLSRRSGQGDPAGAEQIFMTRPEVHEKFRLARRLLGKYRLFASPHLHGVPLRPARVALRGLGQSDPQRPRLAGALLPHRRRPLPRATGS